MDKKQLREIELFSEFEDFELDETLSIAKFVKYKKNEVIIREGDIGDKIFVILSGSVRIYRNGDNGEEIFIKNLSDGNFFGEMCLFNRKTRSASVSALADSEFIWFDNTDFKAKFKDNPNAGLYFLREIFNRMKDDSYYIESIQHEFGRTNNTGRGILDYMLDAINTGLDAKKEYTLRLSEVNKQLEDFNIMLERLVEVRTMDLRESNRKLRAMDKIKTDLLSNVSHELRTPLTSIYGFIKIIRKSFKKFTLPLLLNNGILNKKSILNIESYFDIIVAECKRLTSLIDNMLDISKIESGNIEWNMSPLSIDDVIRQAVASMDSLFKEKELNLIIEIEKELPEIIGDRDRLIQVIINLLSNAVKFTNSGSVKCKAVYNTKSVIISIIDEGIGIEPGNTKIIFEKFMQIGDSLNEKPKGSGLGLTISKEIVEFHGGNINVRSELGKGSDFTITLPLYMKDEKKTA